MGPVRMILVPVDFTPASDAALDEAMRYALLLRAGITLLHVQPFSLTDVPEDLFYPSPNASVRARTSVLKRLSDMADARLTSGIPIRTELREGIAWDQIIGAASQLGADMIIMGTKPRSGLTHGIIGSVAERVVRTSTVPVMTVRASVAHGDRTDCAAR